MKKGLIVIFVSGLIILPLAVSGCKGRAKVEDETAKTEATDAVMVTEDIVVTQAPVTEQNAGQGAIMQETIPPTATVPPVSGATSASEMGKLEHNKEIQTALKAAKFYTGEIDGKIGPRTKRAIVEFQKANGLKPDGKVGPKTWAELGKYLKQ